jgi:hypothetical protein
MLDFDIFSRHDMHVRTSKKRRNGKKYEYPQLVESYRRKPDGMPVHRVIMSLAHLSPIELNNLKVALEASRKGKPVVVGKAPPLSKNRPHKPTANLRYLNLAVLLELWREWQLDELFEKLLPQGDAEVAPSKIVCALTLQRCVDPGSKHYAERWFPKTALPELLGISPQSFNNTRVHRVLDGLDQCGYELVAKLPRLYASKEGAFATMFLDVTDTWFVGHGPEIAERAKTKEGEIRRKVGIVLLCNDHGYPLRWEVIRGRESDKESMPRMARSIKGLSWVGDTPMVCDRAMGNTAQIRQLLDTQIHFLTALTVGEFGSYTSAIPHQPFADFALKKCKDNKEKKQSIVQAGEFAEAAGMKRVEEKLFVLDLGIIERFEDNTVSLTTEDNESDLDETMKAVSLGRQVRNAIAEGEDISLAAAGRALGLKGSVTKKYRRLANLSEDVQNAVLEGKARGVSIAELLSLESYSDFDEQQKEFERISEKATVRYNATPKKRKPSPKNTLQKKGSAFKVRAVAYFNPERFLEQRLGAQREAEEIEAFCVALNNRLARSSSKMKEEKIRAEVYQKLRSYHLIEAYDVQITNLGKEGSGQYQLQLNPKMAEWAARRRYHGFSLLIAHPDVKHTAVELCRMYRAKDMVEKDFEAIKSFVKLRPIWHRLDAKVRAHVNVCMLSLLLQRTLDKKLTGQSTAQRALEDLADCNLNMYCGEKDTAYALTETNTRQDSILRSLRLRQLVDDDEVADRLTPR